MAGVISGCSDPADKVTKAPTSAPRESAQPSITGKSYAIQPESTIGFVGKYPTATFTTIDIKSSDLQKTVTGNLDLHGVTKSITFPADIQVAGNAVMVKAEFAINRKDFNINYAGKADDLIRDNVILKLDIKAASSELQARKAE